MPQMEWLYRKDGLREIHGSVWNFIGPPYLAHIKKTGLSREGHAWDKNVLEKYVFAYGFYIDTEVGFMNIIETLKNQYEATKELWERYDEKSKNFRATVKNDIASIEASSRKTTEAVQKMHKAYGQVIGQLNGQEMTDAIANAERLAHALETIANLQSHNLAVEIVKSKPPEA